MGLLEGKAVVITGSGDGIGRACAIDAASRGARVVVNDVRGSAAEKVVGEIKEAGGTAVACVASVSSWDGAGSIIDTCVQNFGHIDGLVNNAALGHRGMPWEDTEAEIRALVEVNVLGPLFCGKHAMIEMLKQGGGTIINFSSVAAFGLSTRGTYSATKGAVASATYSWAFDLMPHNIRVNAIAPSTQSRMASNWVEIVQALGYEGTRPPTDDAVKHSATKPATPASQAPLVTFLLSDLSKNITGQFFQFHAPRLTVVRRPATKLEAGPYVENEAWTPELIADAFQDTLRSQLQPVVDYHCRVDAPRWPEEAAAHT